MRAGARLTAAIGVLDAVCAGQPAEQALTNWARGSRFAGSGDRAAVRDLVFTALRCRRSHAALGGAETGRGLILGQLAETGQDPGPLFTGTGHDPAPLSGAEAARLAAPPVLPLLVALDCPDWIAPALEASLGAGFAPVMQSLRRRAPVFLRVNAARGSRAAAAAALAAEGVTARPHPLAETALEITANARRLRQTRAYAEGLVELQDAASQAVVAALPRTGGRVLDYCAGGGGKALAIAALDPRADIIAHDAAPRRMADLPARAARAGARVALADAAGVARAAPYDLVLCDVPCSGSGAWRRAPEGKWRLDAAALAGLFHTQAQILDRAAGLVAPGGTLAYATCSLLADENETQADAFLGRAGGAFRAGRRLRLTPLDGGDGFFLGLAHRV